MKTRTYGRYHHKVTLNQRVTQRLPKQRSLLDLLMVLAALFITATLSGCTGLTSASAPSANTSSSTSSSGTLAASATSFSFGNVAIGSSTPQTLTLTNTGTSVITISQATVTGAGFSVVGGMSSVAIAAGQSHPFQVQFAPQAVGSVTGGIAVISDASNSPLSVSLSGTGVVAPSITTQPASQSVTTGQTANFTVAAIGSGALTYQWNRNGTAISGATSSMYTTPATISSDNGAQFTVTVSNSIGNMTSSAATLTVTDPLVPPSITTQPADQTIAAGQTATFAVVATSSNALTYQWEKNGTAISGATSPAYTTPATTPSDDSAQIAVTVTNPAGKVKSRNAKLNVNSPPSITTQPASQAVTAGQTANFTVAATGTATLTYQWKKNGTAITGATSASYTTPATTTSDNGAQFAATVTNSLGNVTSSAATITVNIAPSITTQPVSQTVTAGQTATFTVAATGTATLTYQWKKNGTAITGATSTSYTTPATMSSDNGAQFTVTVTNSAGNVTSSAATLTVNVAPSIATQPVSQTVTAGQTATFAVAATGTSTLTYQWKKNGTAITGATSTSYTTPATTSSDNGAQFTVTVTNSAGNVTSSAATLTVTAAPVAPSITTQPASQTVTAGQTATFTVAATGTATLTYQWNKNGTAITGATSTSYTTPATTSSDNGAQFAATVTNSLGNVTSSTATLTVNVAPSITTQPANQTVNAGQTATFTVAATSTTTLTYQWKKNGTAISGATSASYTTPATTASDNGAQFTVTVTNSAGNVTSNAATLTVNAATYLLNTSATSLNFANVNIGSSNILSVIFTNAGNSNVTVSNVSITGAGFTASGVSTGQILAPAQTATLNVTFTPAAAASVAGSVTVTSNATNSPAMISLSGTGVQPVSHSVTLNWTASTSTVAGYNMYRSATSSGPYTKLNSALVTSTQYVDSGIQCGQTYYYVTTSIDSSDVESAYSNQVFATIPTP
jgi:hypothetical protein